jgi:Fe-S oxidoreductase
LDVEVGKDAIELLCKLGYDVELFYAESGRTYLSKGFLKQAKKLVEKNMSKLEGFLDRNIPIVGLEPSAILSFRDEYQRLHDNRVLLAKLAAQSYLIEEFLAREIAGGHITAESFTEDERTIKIHNHCHQKALSDQKVTFDVLNLPKNYKVTIIASGCCGMAGSFGYEKEHYGTSMKVGSLKLFPAVKKSDSGTLIAANGTSCRHQIKDGTGRDAEHPVSILRKALVV